MARCCVFVGFFMALTQAAFADTPPPLTFDERVAAQRAIETVYWERRDWPAQNPGPKPALEEVLPDDVLRDRVRDYLQKSNALEFLWGRPVTSVQLQAELDRMSRETTAPDVLRALFAALGNDPYRIAETLARGTLVDRLVRSDYTSDAGFHAETRREAEEALGASSAVDDWIAAGGTYQEFLWERDVAHDGSPGAEGTVMLTDEKWLHAMDWIDDRVNAAMPAGTWGPLVEETDAFETVSVIDRGDRRARVAVVRWSKPNFDDWWLAMRSTIPAEVDAPVHEYTLGVTSGGACVDDTWSLMPLGLAGRTDYAAVWTGAEMLIWGGWLSPNYLNTGGRYNPATGHWTPTSLSPAPQPRPGWSYVWTGTELLIWGGYRFVWQQAEPHIWYGGGRYNPTLNTWAGLYGAGAHLAVGHGAVWTGSQMLVWGGSVPVPGVPLGQAGATSLPVGSRYDPVSNSWSPMSTVGAPQAREDHSIVWTGSEMVVWGGRQANGVPPPSLNDGGRYDPASDTWTPTSMAGAPSPRTAPAVWTGSEMLVWAGYDVLPNNTLVVITNGARYAPSADTWTPITTTGAPQGTRIMPVWTGAEMLVWGGQGGSGQVQTGGRYDPLVDLWTPISLSGAPSARADFTPVWTGSQLLVWSGYSISGSILNDGGHYCAVAPDGDGDGTANVTDCAPLDAGVWSGPAAATDLTLSGESPTSIGWDPPVEPGSSSWTYDLLRSESASDFSAAACLVIDASAATAEDSDPVSAGAGFHYLVRVENTCGGNLGTSSDGDPRTGVVCP